MDDKTVKCFLSNEELEEYEIDYKDFVMRSEKAREVVQEIMEHASEEVGYRPPRFAFDLQIMMVPEQGLVLTFSEREPDIKDGEHIMECLKEMKRILQKTKETVGQSATAEQGSGETTPQKQEAVAKPEYAVFVFSNIRNVMNYAAGLPSNLRVNSELYKMDDWYYLYLEKGHASYERYSRACIQALEYAALYTAEESRVRQLREHGSCLIAEKAIRKLRG